MRKTKRSLDSSPQTRDGERSPRPDGAEYLNRPGPAEMARHERAIRRAGLSALGASAAAALASYLLLPLVFTFPTDLAERLAFAAQASVFVLLWVLVGVAMVSTTRRRSAADSGGAAAGPPSAALAIRSAFLQNTLEQAVLAAGAYIALATLTSGDALAVVIAAVVLFAVGRTLFYRGYPRGASGRALGMTLTMTPTILIYLAALALLGMSLFDRSAT
jgi:uncharacterized membrane protein YecN with MAPEG domain